MGAPRFDNCTFLVTASRGTEDLLAEELRELGFDSARRVQGGVVIEASLRDGMRACLWSRIGQRVLLFIGRRRVRDQRELYDATRSLPLSDWFHPDRTFAVYARTSDNEALHHSKFVALKVKDAIVDDVRQGTGRRPDINTFDPDLGVTVHIHGEDARYYLDMVGRPLNQRGYRVREVEAPAKETLAAALLRFSGWAPPKPLHDPTCGSGTIAIEAAMIATNTAPNGERDFAFERWPLPRALEGALEQLRQQARDARVPYRGVIIASDRDKDAVQATRANVAAAGFADRVIVRQADARDVEPLLGGGWFICNPPYGERIGGDDEQIEKLYDRMASQFAQASDNPVAMLGMRGELQPHFGAADHCLDVLNGKLRCEFSVWE